MRFRVELSGDRIKTGSVPLDVLGRFLVEFQGLIISVAEATQAKPKNPKHRKAFYENLKFYASDIEEGSAKIVIETQEQLNLDDMYPVMDPLQKTLEGIDIIQEPDEDQSYKKLERIYPRHDDRVHIFNRYKGIWAIPGVDISVTMPGDEWTKRGFKSKYTIQQSYKPRIDKWLEKEIKKTTETVIGIITRIKGDGPDPYFTILDENRKPMEVHYKKEEEKDVINLYKSPVKVRGIIKTIKTKTSIQSLLALEPLESITVDKDECAVLLDPLNFVLEYHDDRDEFAAANEDIGINVTSDTIGQLKEKILALLDFMVDYYLVQKEGNVSDELQKSIDNLSQMVDISKRVSEIKWVES